MVLCIFILVTTPGGRGQTVGRPHEERGLWAAQSVLGTGSYLGRIPSPIADIGCAK